MSSLEQLQLVVDEFNGLLDGLNAKFDGTQCDQVIEAH